jgi:hypothetical protein
MAIGAGSAQLGALLAMLAMNTSRYASSSAGAGIVVAVLSVAALGATVAALVLHVRLVGVARSSVLAAVAEAPHTG